jgi:hypothetical protein
MHKGLDGRDIVDEMIRLCHDAGMDVVLYYSLIYNNLVYKTEPSSRIVDIHGQASLEKGKSKYPVNSKFGVCCPNSKVYRSIIEQQIKELFDSYSFEGIFYDMTFWPDICYCDNCKIRFAEETGEAIPPSSIGKTRSGGLSKGNVKNGWSNLQTLLAIWP